MAVMAWPVVLPICEQPRQDLPSNTRLHRLLVSLLDISTQGKLPLHVCLHNDKRVTTLPQLQATGTESPLDGVALLSAGQPLSDEVARAQHSADNNNPQPVELRPKAVASFRYTTQCLTHKCPGHPH